MQLHVEYRIKHACVNLNQILYIKMPRKALGENI